MTPFQLHDMETAPHSSLAIMADMQSQGGDLPNLLRTLALSSYANHVTATPIDHLAA